MALCVYALFPICSCKDIFDPVCAPACSVGVCLPGLLRDRDARRDGGGGDKRPSASAGKRCLWPDVLKQRSSEDAQSSRYFLGQRFRVLFLEICTPSLF